MIKVKSENIIDYTPSSDGSSDVSKTYVDNRDAYTLQQAKSYTDSVTSSSGCDGGDVSKEYVDTQDASVLQAATVAKARADSAYTEATKAATTTLVGRSRLNTSVTSASTAEAATPSAVKQAYDLAKANIIESGTNSNGDYTKFPGGTLICTKTVTWTGAIATASGNVYIGSSMISLGNWAIPFVGKVPNPSIQVFPTGNNNTVWHGMGNISPTLTNIGSVHIVSQMNRASTSYAFAITGIGKWK